jgi:hypothetical protein
MQDIMEDDYENVQKNGYDDMADLIEAIIMDLKKNEYDWCDGVEEEFEALTIPNPVCKILSTLETHKIIIQFDFNGLDPKLHFYFDCKCWGCKETLEFGYQKELIGTILEVVGEIGCLCKGVQWRKVLGNSMALYFTVFGQTFELKVPGKLYF